MTVQILSQTEAGRLGRRPRSASSDPHHPDGHRRHPADPRSTVRLPLRGRLWVEPMGTTDYTDCTDETVFTGPFSKESVKSAKSVVNVFLVLRKWVSHERGAGERAKGVHDPERPDRAVTAVDGVSLEVKRENSSPSLGPVRVRQDHRAPDHPGFENPTFGPGAHRRAGLTHLPPHVRTPPMVSRAMPSFPHLTVAQNVAFGLEMRASRRRRFRQVRGILELVEAGRSSIVRRSSSPAASSNVRPGSRHPSRSRRAPFR